jgi:hypothetical protein
MRGMIGGRRPRPPSRPSRAPIRSPPRAANRWWACSRCSSAWTARRRRPWSAGALSAGVPRELVVEELQREVERRLLRAADPYDAGRA